jgi:hypothetical protein
MFEKKFIGMLHHSMSIIILLIFITLPLIYIKYIAWIPLAVGFSWVIFNGCVIDNLHHDNANCDSTLTDNVTPILELFNKTFANYICEKYLKNTNRPTYISFSYFVLLLTIVCYRLIFNIDFIKLQSKQV